MTLSSSLFGGQRVVFGWEYLAGPIEASADGAVEAAPDRLVVRPFSVFAASDESSGWAGRGGLGGRGRLVGVWVGGRAGGDLAEPVLLIGGERGAQVGEGPAGLEGDGVVSVGGGHQELTLLEGPDDRVELLGGGTPLGGLDSFQYPFFVPCGVKVTDHPGAAVADHPMVEVVGVLGADHHPDSAGATHLEGCQEGGFGGGLGDRGDQPEPLVQVDDRPQVRGGPGWVRIHSSRWAYREATANSCSRGLRWASDITVQGARPPTDSNKVSKESAGPWRRGANDGEASRALRRMASA